MNINYILTFDTGDQGSGNLTVRRMFPTKKAAVARFKKLVRKEKRHLIKVSMCLSSDSPPPRWYMEANGKLWCDDLGTVKFNRFWH